jgi:hypothetical protein
MLLSKESWFSALVICKCYNLSTNIQELSVVQTSDIPFPLCDQSGGSSCPWGSRPFSRHDRNESRWPPFGKWIGGRWTPSCPTSTMVPPLSAVTGTHNYSYYLIIYVLEFKSIHQNYEHGMPKHNIKLYCTRILCMCFNLVFVIIYFWMPINQQTQTKPN